MKIISIHKTWKVFYKYNGLNAGLKMGSDFCKNVENPNFFYIGNSNNLLSKDFVIVSAFFL